MRKRIPFIVFPALLLLLCALERLSTFLLSVYPASPDMWRLWFIIRPAGYLASFGLDRLSGNDMAIQAGILALITAALLYALSHPKAVMIYFLTNHLALIATASAVFLTTDANTASLTASSFGMSSINLLSDMHLSAAQVALAIVGLISCVFCHYAFLSEKRGQHAHIDLQITALQHSL